MLHHYLETSLFLSFLQRCEYRVTEVNWIRQQEQKKQKQHLPPQLLFFFTFLTLFFAFGKFLSRHLSRVCSNVNKPVMAINDLERAEFIIFYKCYHFSSSSTLHFTPTSSLLIFLGGYLHFYKKVKEEKWLSDRALTSLR